MTTESGWVIGYTGGTIDRASERRADAAWIESQAASPQVRVVPVWRDRNLVFGLSGGMPRPRAGYLSGATARELLRDGAAEAAVFLGLAKDGPVFAADVSPLGDAAVLAPEGEFAEIRGLAGALPADEAALLATARGMLHWHRTHRFCGSCGASTISREAGHSRICSNPECGREHYPRLDPAVIMLVETVSPETGEPLCLLAHNARFPRGVFSTLAGFVELGETLEQAVRREVQEEVGVRVSEVSYRASQPWPFPSSVMLGFRARAESLFLRPDRLEVDDARWFRAIDVACAGEWADEQAEVRLPRRDSIARYLVDGWLRDVGA